MTEINGVLFFHVSHFFQKLYSCGFPFCCAVFYLKKIKSIFDAKNENSESSENAENAENAENSH